jgi:hypothetical protein
VETRTAGSASGLRKRTSSNAGTAPQADSSVSPKPPCADTLGGMTNDLTPRLAELRRDAQKVVDYASEGTCRRSRVSSGLLDYPLADVHRDADGVLRSLDQSGIRPGGGD